MEPCPLADLSPPTPLRTWGKGCLSASVTTTRSETLEFGWDGPLQINAKETPISGFKHFENPYCTAAWPARNMEIRFKGQTLTLDVS